MPEDGTSDGVTMRRSLRAAWVGNARPPRSVARTSGPPPGPDEVEATMKNAVKTAVLLAGLGALFMVVGGAIGGSTGL